MLAPVAGRPAGLVNVSHLIPQSLDDLQRRRRAFELIASSTGGMMGRTPDYLNVTFACFAGASSVWARRGNEQGAANLVAYHELMRDCDLSTTHSIMNPQVDRSKPEADQAAGEVALHKIGETDTHIVVRGARMLATLGALRRRPEHLPGLRHPPAGRQLRARLRGADGHARPEADLPRLVRPPAVALRLPAVVAVRRDGLRRHLRRRRGAEGPRVPRRRHGRLLGGHLRHRLARPHHAPGLHARLREALVRPRPRPPDRHHDRRRAASTTSRRSSARCGTWRS